MKKYLFPVLLAAEAALCLIYQLLHTAFSDLFVTAAAFPFEPLSLGLRALSLSGVVGNVLSWILYLAICLVPLAFYGSLLRSGRLQRADHLIPVMSILLFAVLYFMINPGLMWPEFPQAEKLLLGGAFWSVFFCWLVLRFLRRYDVGPDRQQRGLQLLLYGVILLFVYAIFGAELRNCLDAIREVRDGNTAADGGWMGSSPVRGLGTTYVFLVLKFLVDSLPYALDIWVTFLGLRFLEALSIDRYSDDTIAAAGRLADTCRLALTIMVVVSMLFNLAQLLFVRTLLSVNMQASLPILSMAFVLAVLLASGYIRENQRLKRDNDLFI